MRRSKVVQTEGAVSDPRPELKLTYEDYLCFPDDGKRREIIDGELYVTAAPNLKHQSISINLASALKLFLDQARLGRVFAAPTDVVLSEVDVVEPDILFVSKERAERLTESNVQGAPDLVVEILSPSTRRTDERIKLKRYERFHVREYWIVDPELEIVKVYRRGAKAGLERVAELAQEAGDALTTPLLPGLTIPLAKVFE